MRLQLAKEKMANGGEVEFIEYKDHQIMYGKYVKILCQRC
jgi:hypothetical protein